MYQTSTPLDSVVASPDASAPTCGERHVERRASFRTSYVDGRLGNLVVRADTLLVVRVLDDSTGGFRVVANSACPLPAEAVTVLKIDGGDVAVRIVYKRLEGPRTFLGLQRLPL